MLTYQRIKQELARHLRTGYRPGQRLPSIMQLADELNLGRTNTHRAVRELVREGLLISRPGQGTFLRDPRQQAHLNQLSVSASALAGRHIGILRVFSHEPMMAQVVSAAESWLTTAGAHVSVVVREPRASDDRYEQALAELDGSDGLMLVQIDEANSVALPANVPTVMVSSSLPQGSLRDGRIDLVTPDSYQGALLAGAHLSRCPCDAYLYVGVGATSSDGRITWDDISEERWRGFRCGLKTQRPVRQQAVSNYLSDLTLVGCAGTLREAEGKLGIFAASDELAMGLALAAMAQGRTLGRDLHIVGFDGQHRGRQLAGGALSSIDIPTRAMGVEAAYRLAQRLADPHEPSRHVQLPCAFHQGATSSQGD